MKMKGYLIAAEPPFLCFDVGGEAFVGRYDWKPTVNVLTDYSLREQLASENSEFKSPRKVFVNRKPVEVRFSIGSERTVANNRGNKNLRCLSIQLDSIEGLNQFTKELAEKHNAWIENGTKEEMFYSNLDLRWGAEYEIDADAQEISSEAAEVSEILKKNPEDPIKKISEEKNISKASAEKIYKALLKEMNPDGSPIFSVKEIQPTGNYIQELRVAAHDEESALRSGSGLRAKDTVAIALASPEGIKIFTYKPPNFSGTTNDFREQYIAPHIDGIDGKVILSDNREKMLTRFSKALQEASQSAHAIANYNGRGHDTPRLRKQIQEFGIELFGRAGWPYKFRSASAFRDEPYLDMVGGLCDVVDIYPEIERLIGMPMGRKKLKTVEAMLGIPRTEEFHASESGAAMLGHEKFYEVLVHVSQDVRNTRELAENILFSQIGQPVSLRKSGTWSAKKLAALEYRKFLSRKSLHSGIPVSRKTLNDKPLLSSYADNIRVVNLSSEPEELAMAEFRMEAEIIERLNISPDALWCGHEECRGAPSFEVERLTDKKIHWPRFCTKETGKFVEFLRELGDKKPELVSEAAQLLRDAEDGGVCFIEDIAAVMKKLLERGFERFPRMCKAAKIVETGRIFLSDYDSAKKDFPQYIGRKIGDKVKVVKVSPPKDSEGDSASAYAYELSGTPVVIGAKLHNNFYPSYLNGLIDSVLLQRLNGEPPKEIGAAAEKKIQEAAPEDFVLEFVDERRAKQIKGKDFISKLKKRFLSRHEALAKANGIPLGEDSIAHIVGAITKKGPRLVEEMTESDWQEISRETYLHMVSSALERILPGYEAPRFYEPKMVPRNQATLA